MILPKFAYNIRIPNKLRNIIVQLLYYEKQNCNDIIWNPVTSKRIPMLPREFNATWLQVYRCYEPR